MFETERLILRTLEKSDLEDIFAMRRDPAIMRYIREPQKDIESSAKWITMMAEKWDQEKLGFWGIVEKASGEFAGWAGLWRLTETDDIEVGYAIAKKFWGRGFATEAADRCLQYGFEDLELDRIVAVAFPDNKASQKVMTKLGMSYVKIGTYYEKQLVQYAVLREEYDRN